MLPDGMHKLKVQSNAPQRSTLPAQPPKPSAVIHLKGHQMATRLQ